MTAPQDHLGRPLNPDTGVPYPTASAAHLELVAELLARRDAMPSAEPMTRAEVERYLVEAVVRQHGRTLRACLAELRDTADDLDQRARRLVVEGTEGEMLYAMPLAGAAQLTASAWTVRGVMLRGDRA